MRKNYPILRNVKLEGTGMPPHFVDEKKERGYLQDSRRISKNNAHSQLDEILST